MERPSAGPSTGARTRAPVGRPRFTSARVALNNVPYATTVLLGGGVFLAGFGPNAAGWLAAGLYLVYGALGALWLMLFVCRNCAFHGRSGCPSGFGRVAGLLRGRGDVTRFSRSFKTHVPVVATIWFVAPAAGGMFLWQDGFSWPLVAVLGSFILDAFVILPLSSKGHGCSTCPQSRNCPWSSGGREAQPRASA